MAKKKITKKTTKKQTAAKKKKTSLPKISILPKNKYVQVILYLLLGIFLIMSGLGLTKVSGQFIYDKLFFNLIGYSFWLLPIITLLVGRRIFNEKEITLNEIISTALIPLSLTVLLDLWIKNDSGGQIGVKLGEFFGSSFGIGFSTILFLGLIAICLFIIFDPKMETLKNIKEKAQERFEEKEEIEQVPDAKTSEQRIEEQIAKATEKNKQDSPAEEPAKKSFAITGITKKKKEPVDEISIDTKGVFSSSYTPPPLSLLGKSSGKPSTGNIKANANLIQRTLSNFGIAVEMDEISIGPTVTRYAMKPAQGVRLSKIASLQNELALALAAKSIRIEAPIPGRSLVGIEVPNSVKSKIGLGTQLAEAGFQDPTKPLLVSLGKGVSGKSHFANIGKMPHALIAGATGAGKSVTIHNIVVSLLYKNGPDMLRFIMIDPKRVEMTLYKKIPHLLTPVITDPKKAVLALKWAVKEMERRYDVLQQKTVRDIDSYHKTVVAPAYKDLSQEEIEDRSGDLPEKMPYIVVIIDELSDIMSSYPRELEASIVRLAQMSRAVGIHLMLATQRPSVNVITGLIKANVPARLALKVASQIDSRTILDSKGAEKLLGYGDMLYKGEGSNEPVRIQCPYVSEEEVKNVVEYIQKHYKFEMSDEISLPDENLQEGGGGVSLAEDEKDDPLLQDAIQTVIASKKASTSYLQRRLSIGYSRAARIIDIMEDKGIIGPANGSKPREVYETGQDNIDTDTETDGMLG